MKSRQSITHITNGLIVVTACTMFGLCLQMQLDGVSRLKAVVSGRGGGGCRQDIYCVVGNGFGGSSGKLLVSMILVLIVVVALTSVAEAFAASAVLTVSVVLLLRVCFMYTSHQSSMAVSAVADCSVRLVAAAAEAVVVVVVALLNFGGSGCDCDAVGGGVI